MGRGNKNLIVKFGSHDQDGRHTHMYGKKKQQPLCPVTVLVDSQVSDRCPWATCSRFCFKT